MIPGPETLNPDPSTRYPQPNPVTPPPQIPKCIRRVKAKAAHQSLSSAPHKTGFDRQFFSKTIYYTRYSFGRFWPAAATASSSSSSSSTDPPGAAPSSSIPQIQPYPLLTADERLNPSSAAPHRPLPLSARAEVPFLAILDDRRDFKRAWEPLPAPPPSTRSPSRRRGRFTLYFSFLSAAGQK